jgi:hypothetical protein
LGGTGFAAARKATQKELQMIIFAREPNGRAFDTECTGC